MLPAATLGLGLNQGSGGSGKMDILLYGNFEDFEDFDGRTPPPS